MKKRLLSLALCLALCLGLFPFGVLAEEAGGDSPPEEVDPTYVATIGDTQYETLTDALEAANTSEASEVTVKLLQDTDLTESYYYTNSKTKLILDLNGKRITSENASYLVLEKGSNTSAVIQDNSTDQNSYIRSIQVENTCDLTIEGGYIDNLQIIDSSLCLNGGTVNQATVSPGDSSTFTISGSKGYIDYLSIGSIKTIEGSLTGGSFGKINSSPKFSLLLAAGYAFLSDGHYWVPRSSRDDVQTNMVVKKCEHVLFVDERCVYCGLAKADCTHETVNADGTCTADHC